MSEININDSVDEFGRRTPTSPRPDTRLLFTSRAHDRRKTMETWEPEDILAALRDAEAGDLRAQSELFEHMEEKDGALAGFMQTRRLAPAGLKWDVIANGDNAQSKEAREIAELAVASIPGWRWSLIDLADAIGKGISASVIDWTPDADIAGIRHVNPRRYRFPEDEDRLLIAKETELAEMEKLLAPPPYKMVVHKTKMRTGHPARGGVLRVVVWLFLIRNYVLKDWSAYSEVFGMPMRVGKYPPNASGDEKADLVAALKSLGTDAVAVISENTNLEIKEAINRGNQPYGSLMQLLRSEMAIAILGQELTNTVTDSGARAQAAIHNDVRNDILAADCEDLQETIRRDLLFPLIGFKKGWDFARKHTPVFKFRYEPPVDRKLEAEVDKSVLIDMGLGKHVTVGWLASKYGFQLADGVDPKERVISADQIAPKEAPPSRRPENRDYEDEEGNRNTRTEDGVIRAVK